MPFVFLLASTLALTSWSLGIAANLLVNRLLEMLSIYDGSDLTRGVRCPVRCDNFNLRLAGIESSSARTTILISRLPIGIRVPIATSSGRSASISTSSGGSLALFPELAKVTISGFDGLPGIGSKCSRGYEYIRLVYEATLSHLALLSATSSARTLHVHFKVAVHPSHQGLVVVYETFNLVNGITIAGRGAEQLMISLDARHSLDDIAAHIQSQSHRQSRPPDRNL